MERVVLAYSGGLDTSVILKWLVEKGYEVIAYVADVGQKDDFKEIEKKALAYGASKVYIKDLKKEFVTNFIFPTIKANAIYENKYLLGTSIARPLISKEQIKIAKQEGAKIVSHGCTGKGNDQVRFELAYLTLMPDVKIFSPWKNREFLSKFKGRKDMLKYAKEKNIQVKATYEKPYSTDQNLMHTSFEAGVLEDPAKAADLNMLELCVPPHKAPDNPTIIKIEFDKGIPVKVFNESNGNIVEGSLELFQYLNKIGGENGIGIIDLVESRFVGMKNRGVYETPAGTILLKAHMDLEGITLDKEVIHIKNGLGPKISQIIYNGFWYSPEMEFLMAAIEKSQKYVTGTITLSLHKGHVMVIAREAPNSLYDAGIASMDEEGDYDPIDAKGFININALRLKMYAKQKGDFYESVE